MTVDHVGVYLVPTMPELRFVGRLAFPIFAYLIAEGCHYTRSRRRYLASMAVFGALAQLVLWVGRHTFNQSIFTTFVLSIATIYALDWWARAANAVDTESGSGSGFGSEPAPASPVHTWRRWVNIRILAPLATLAIDVVVSTTLPKVVPFGFYVQYRFPGVLLPVLAYLPWLTYARGETLPAAGPRRCASLALFAVGLVVVAATGTSSSQWWSLVALVPLALYNGERGRHVPKYFFYAYYPLHLAVIFALAAYLG